LKTPQSPVIFDWCLRKTRSGKSRDYRDIIVFEKLRFQNVLRPQKRKAGVFNFFRLAERLQQAPFS